MSTHDTTPRDADEPTWFENLEHSETGGGAEVEPAPTPPPPVVPVAPARLRVGTVVWGLILAIVGIGVTAIGAGAAVDLQAGIIVLLVVAGVALLGGALVAARRSRP